MARIRYLKPEFFKDEDLALLPFEVRLFFAGLWNFADKAGRLEERILRLKVEIFPYDKVDINNCLDLLSKPKNGSGRPFIQRYEVDGQKYIQIIKWENHQKPHHTEKDSIFPPAPPLNTKGNGEGNGEAARSELVVKERLKDVPLTVKSTNYQELEAFILTKWNELCLDYPVLPKIKEITGNRRQHLKKRFEQESFRDFKSILSAIKDQPFLLGENDRKWVVNFDWIIENDTNYMKVLERKYKSNSPGDLRDAFQLKGKK